MDCKLCNRPVLDRKTEYHFLCLLAELDRLRAELEQANQTAANNAMWYKKVEQENADLRRALELACDKAETFSFSTHEWSEVERCASYASYFIQQARKERCKHEWEEWEVKEDPICKKCGTCTSDL